MSSRSKTGKLKCYACGKVKRDTCFSRDASRAARRGRCRRCKDCVRDYRAMLKYRDPAHYRFRKLQQGSRGIKVTITVDEFRSLYSQARCEACGAQLDFSFGARAPNSWTLDRVDSSQAYTPGNLGVLCLRCNWAKNSTSIETMRKLLTYMERKSGTEQVKKAPSRKRKKKGPRS